MTAFGLISIALLIAFIIANWWLPRRFGVAEMVLGQVALLVAYFMLAGAAMNLGRYEYDGAMSIIGLTIQAFILNGLLLPIALVALWRRRRAVGP